MSWDLEELRRAVEKRYDSKQRDLLDPVLQSIADRRYFASYHHGQALKLIAEHLDDKDEAGRLKLEFGVTADKSVAYRTAKLQAYAHVVASLQSVHSLSDTLAHAIYFSLGINLDPLKAPRQRDVNLGWVIGRMSELPNCCGIADTLRRLRNNDDFRYLGHVVNRSKHQSVVRAGVTQHLGESARTPWTLELQSFEFDRGGARHSYPSRAVDPFLPDEFLRQTKLIVEVGQLLNKLVQ